MEILRAQPPEGERHHDESYERLVVGQLAPHPLMNAFHALCRANSGRREIIRKHFPMLEGVDGSSNRYVDEDLWLNSTEVEQLVEEFGRLRRICRRKEFITHLDGPATYEAWRSGEAPETFDGYLDDIEGLLQKAIASGYVVRLML